MATVEWTGATDNNMATATNYVRGAAPVNGDSFIAKVLPTNPVQIGNSVNLVTFTVTDAYGANPIGTLSAGLALGTVTTFTIGARCPYVNLAPGNVTTANLQMPNGCDVYLNGSATWTTTIVSSGLNVYYGASATFTTVYSTSVAGSHNFATGSATTTFKGPATLNTNRTITTCTLEPGSIGTFMTAAASTTLNAVGAIVKHQSSGTLATVNLSSRALLTPLGNVSGTAACTTVNVWSDSSYVLAVPGATLTGTFVPIGATGLSTVGVPS